MLPDKSLQYHHLKHIAYGAGVGLVHTLFCWACYYVGLFRLEAGGFFLYFGIAWLGHLVFLGAIVSGLNLKLNDPSLMFLHMLWSLLVFLGSVYLLDRMRISVMMMYLTIMLIGSFQVGLKGFIAISVLSIFGYGGVLYWISQERPETFFIATEFLQELIQWITASVLVAAFAVFGADISGLRRALGKRNEELQRALERISEIGIKDELTGLYNRRHMNDILEKQKALADRGDYGFVICYLDLDHFKKINDNFGHNVGDEVLKIYSDICQRQIRSIDYCGRFGGEEFVLVLAKTNLEGAKIVAERIRSELEAYDFNSVTQGLSVTVSVGLTPYHNIEPVMKTVARADAALYRAKESGRNRVVAMDQENQLIQSKQSLKLIEQKVNCQGGE